MDNIKYFNDKFHNGTLSDKDRLFLVELLYGDLNLIETLEEMCEEGFDNEDKEYIEYYIKKAKIERESNE
jgi:hypothetical protein